MNSFKFYKTLASIIGGTFLCGYAVTLYNFYDLRYHQM